MRSAPRPAPGRRAVRLRTIAVSALTAVAALTATMAATPAASSASAGYVPQSPVNPLANRPWGVYTGVENGAYPAYDAATGRRKMLLGRIALRPRVRWFGSWLSPTDVTSAIRNYIDVEQHGDPNVLVQLATFRLWPQHEDKKSVPLTQADQDAYKRWVDAAARGIGSSRVALILEPDLPVSLTGWRPSVRLALAHYATSVFSQLPNASVYIEVGSADWLQEPDAVNVLKTVGVGLVRGFALNGTHYDGTVRQIHYGAQIVRSLAKAGIPDRHFVINTASNGRPFTNQHFWDVYPHGNFDNPPVCTTATQQTCVTLGIPPTWQVDAPQWNLPSWVLPATRSYVDGYLWWGRPWLYNQADPFQMYRALNVARTTPWANF